MKKLSFVAAILAVCALSVASSGLKRPRPHPWQTAVSDAVAMAMADAELRQNLMPISSISGPVTGAVAYGGGTYAGWSAAPTTGYLLQGTSTGAPTWTTNPTVNTATVSQTALGTTPSEGAAVQNTTVSTVGTQDQYSPALDWIAHAWNPVSSADNYARFRMDVRPTSGGVITDILHILASIDTGSPSFADAMTLDSNGNAVFNGKASAASLAATGQISSQAYTINEPVVTDSSKNLTTVSYPTLAASLPFASLSGISFTSPAQGDLLYNNGTNWVNLAHGVSGQWLQTGGSSANPSWQSSANSFTTGTGSNKLAYDSGSGTYGLTPLITYTAGAGLTFAPSTGDSAVTISPGANSLTWEKGTAYSSSDFPTWINFLDSSSASNFKVSQGASGQTNLFLLTATGDAGISALALGPNGYTASGTSMGNIDFGGNPSGSYFISSQIKGISNEAQASGKQGGRLDFLTTPAGTTSLTTTVQILPALVANKPGDVLLNASGAAAAANATVGFPWLTTCAGVPTGTPALGATGAAPVIIDSSGQVPMLYLGGVWSDFTSGEVTNATNLGYSILSTDKIVYGSPTSVNRTYTLPTAANFVGHELLIISPVTDAILEVVTPQAGDTLYNAGASAATVTIGTGGTYGHYVRIVSLGSNKEVVVGGG